MTGWNPPSEISSMTISLSEAGGKAEPLNRLDNWLYGNFMKPRMDRDSFTWDGITPYTSAGAQVVKQLWKRTRSRSWWTRRVQNILMANSPTLNCINQKIEGRHNSLVSATYELAFAHFVMWSASGVINSTEHIVYEEKMTPSCVVSHLQRTCKA